MMRNCLFDNRLRPTCRYSAHRTAFTLTELVVAVGILVLMLAIAGQVFSVTIRSTGQAAALTEVNQLFRAFEEELRQDLRHVQPGRSLLLIQGNPVNAYWTREGQEADTDNNPATGYAHVADPAREDENGNPTLPRADVLMFFTARETTSFTDPGVTSSLQQVVYAHAILGEYQGPETGYDFPRRDNPEADPPRWMFPVEESREYYPTDTTVSPVPAEEWLLACRRVLLLSSPPPDATPSWIDALDSNAVAFGLADDNRNLRDRSVTPDNWGILVGDTDVVGNFNYDEWVVTPGLVEPWFLPAIFDDATKQGRIGGLATPFMRSRLDPTPPPQLANRLGHYLLPNCASFKVEWTLDPRSEFVAGRLNGTRETFWFDPGRFDPDDPRENPLAELQAVAKPIVDEGPENLRSLFEDRTSHPDDPDPDDPQVWSYSLADRFNGQQIAGDEAWAELGMDGRPNLVVFGAARRNVGRSAHVVDDTIVPEDIFPSALRITIDLYDTERRLDRPIRHVMVVPVGG